jgi:hypothetical protein
MVGAREEGEGAITTGDGLYLGDDVEEDDLDSDLVLFLFEDIFPTLLFTL